MAALAGCQQPPGANVQQNATLNETSPLPNLQVAEPPMDRADLLLASARAASATALARDDLSEQRRLGGNAFEVRIRFGCEPTDSRASMSARSFAVRYDSEDGTLRVRAAPDLALDKAGLEDLAGHAVEAVEGFWIRRPWLLADGCPAQPRPPEPTSKTPNDSSPAGAADATTGAALAPAGRRVGVAQFFTEADSRTGRRAERAYEATKILSEGQKPSSQGYNLVLSGRLRRLPTGRVIACQVQSPDAEPDCIISVQFDRVWIEDPERKQIIAEWTS